jgi:class 3 adenylate cyclase
MAVVGRKVERTTIEGALADALAGRGGLVLLAGEAGIGKTTLAEYATEMARAQGAITRWGRCREGIGAPAFWPWMQVVEPWPKVDEDSDRFELFERVATQLAAAAKERGLVLVLDDLHWADDASIRLLDHLAPGLHDHRVLVIGTYRDDEVVGGHPLKQTLATIVRHGPQLTLRGLREQDVATLARELVDVELDARGASAVTAHTDGNPFFVAEVVRLLASEDRLADLGTTDLGVPSGVAEVVRRRVARLGEEGAEVLAAAAVIGRSFDEPVLETLVDGGADVEKAIDTALTASLIEADGPRPDRYRFSHALVREVVYGDLPRRRRVRLHAELAGRRRDSLAARAHHALAGAGALGIDEAAAIVADAADEALHSGGWEEADRLATQVLELEPGDDASYRALVTRGWARFHLDAPEASTADCLAAAAIAERERWPDRLARALLSVGSGRFIGTAFATPTESFDTCLAMLDDGPETAALRASLISRKIDHQPLGAKDLEASSTAVQLARVSGDREALVTAASRFLLNFCFQGPLAKRRELLDEALGTGPLPRHEIGRHELDAIAFDVRLLIEEGRLDEALVRLRAVSGHAEISRGAIDLRFDEPVTACIATQRGDFDRAVAAVQAWLDEATRRGTTLRGPVIQMLQLTVLRERGVWELVLPALEQARRDLAPTDIEINAIVEATLALGFAELGRVDEALRAIDVVLSHDLATISRGWGGHGMAACCWLAEAAALVGHVDAADRLESIVAPTIDRNVVMGMPPVVALGWGGHYVGLCMLTVGRLDEAREHLSAALLAHETMGAWPIAARSRFHLARLEAAGGRTEAAVVHATEARTISASIGMPVWERRAEALLADLASRAGGVADALQGTLTFVFTDIEGSTEQTTAAGDQVWAATMTEHGRLVRRLVAQHGGRVVKGLGDGFLLVFPSAREAIACAAALQQATSGTATRVRIGMHTGEAELVDGDYLGHHVNLAARVSAAAGAGEVLVSDAVQRIVATRGDVRFGEPRTTTLKGIADDQVLWPVVL